MNHVVKSTLLGLSLFAVLLCTGCANEVRPPDSALGQALLNGAPCSAAGTPTCAGELAPDVSLRDFQTQSESFEKMRSLSDYEGKPTVVALLAGW